MIFYEPSVMGLGAMPGLRGGFIWPLAAGMLWRGSWSIKSSKFSPCGGLKIHDNVTGLGLLAQQAELGETG